MALASRALNTWFMIVSPTSFPTTHWSLMTGASQYFSSTLSAFPAQGLCTSFYFCLEFLPDICRSCFLPSFRSLFKCPHVREAFSHARSILSFLFFVTLCYFISEHPALTWYYKYVCGALFIMCFPTACQFYISRNVWALFTVLSPVLRAVTGIY